MSDNEVISNDVNIDATLLAATPALLDQSYANLQTSLNADVASYIKANPSAKET